MPRRAARDVAVQLRPSEENALQPVPHPSKAAEWGGGDLVGGLVLACRFDAHIIDPVVPYDVRMTVFALRGHLACERLVVHHRSGGPPVTGTGIRQTVVDTYLSRVREELNTQVGAALLFRVSVDEHGERAYEAASDAKPWDELEAKELERTVPDVEKAARIYQEALASADPEENRAPTATVAKRLKISRGYASRLVSRAHEAGLLDISRRSTTPRSSSASSTRP